MRIAVFVTCYNVEAQIVDKVLARIPSEAMTEVDEFVVIDNCSSDQTVQKVLQFRDSRPDMATKLKVIANAKNYGYGGSHKVAFNYLQERAFDWGILLHGDGQGSPNDLPQFIRQIKTSNYDFIIGSRFLDMSLSRDYSLLRKIANKFFIYLQKMVSGVYISDPGSGYIAYNMAFLRDVPYWRLPSYAYYDPCLFLYVSRMRARIHEFPIVWGEVETSSVNMWEYGMRLLWVLLRFRVKGLALESSRPTDYTYALV